MKLSLRTIFFLGLLLGLGHLQSFAQRSSLQEAITLYSEKETAIKSDQIKVFRDDLANKEIEQILALSSGEYLSLDEINFFDNTKTHWATFELANASGQAMNYVIKGGRNSKETYYLIDETEQIVEKRSGYFTPINQRDIKHNYLNQVEVLIPSFEKKRIYVKIECLDKLPLDIRYELTPKNAWSKKMLQMNIFQGIFNGVLIIIILLSLFFFSNTRRPVFLTLGIYAFLAMLYFAQANGFIELLFLPDQDNALPPLWLLPLLIAAAYFRFTMSFNETKIYFPRWHQLFNVLSIITVALFTISSVYLLLTNDFYLTINGMYILLFAYGLLGLVFLYVIYQKGSLINHYFVYGSIFFLLAAMISIAGQFFYLSNKMPVLVQTGFIIEMLIFSLGMSYKSKKEYEEHNITQRSLILQLQQNDKLKENINNKLREDVVQRTQELRIKNVELIKAKETAEKATASKSEFLSVMSHEIRTPLNAIISLSHIMELDNKEQKIAEYIDALKFSAESLHSLINDVLDYNKIEADKLRLEQLEFSLIDLLRNISEIFKFKAKSKGIELRIEVGEHTPDRLIGDPTRLTQIFNNLLSNAIKFTSEGHVTLKVFLAGVKDEKAMIHFDVIDTGIGIPSEKLDLIFKEFEQANNSTTREFGGTGLGLSITKKLLELMNSDIAVHVEGEQGTKFSFEIPFEINKSFNIISYGDFHTERDLRKAKVLVVDDNDMNRLVLNRLLTIWNANFEEASNGEDAIILTSKTTYDVVLMDIEMRPIDGFEAFNRIKSVDSLNQQTPIIAMSAYQTKEFDRDIYEIGFVSFVHKPFDPDELYEKIALQLSKQSS